MPIFEVQDETLKIDQSVLAKAPGSLLAESAALAEGPDQVIKLQHWPEPDYATLKVSAGS